MTSRWHGTTHTVLVYVRHLGRSKVFRGQQVPCGTGMPQRHACVATVETISGSSVSKHRAIDTPLDAQNRKLPVRGFARVDIMRTGAVVLVVLSHAGLTAVPGGSGITIFCVIPGFSITHFYYVNLKNELFRYSGILSPQGIGNLLATIGHRDSAITDLWPVKIAELGRRRRSAAVFLQFDVHRLGCPGVSGDHCRVGSVHRRAVLSGSRVLLVSDGAGAIAVQIVRGWRGQRTILEHLGSAHTDAQSAALIAVGKDKLAGYGTQQQLDPGLEPAWDAPSLSAPRQAVGSTSRVLGEAITRAYRHLGFAEAIGDETFSHLVLTRAPEPISKPAGIRVLAEVGINPPHRNTLLNALERAQERGYRERIATSWLARSPRHGRDGAVSPRRGHPVLRGRERGRSAQGRLLERTAGGSAGVVGGVAVPVVFTALASARFI